MSFLALVLVVIGSTSGNDALRSSGGERSSGNSKSKGGDGKGRSTYTVRAGDNLSTISERTGISLTRLSELNPDLDPQALISGECVNLRTRGDCN